VRNISAGNGFTGRGAPSFRPLRLLRCSRAGAALAPKCFFKIYYQSSVEFSSSDACDMTRFLFLSNAHSQRLNSISWESQLLVREHLRRSTAS
jgi:hypothetical protein